jgi:ribosome-associated toxin RatA of RatAB toxin-antitoxin module
MAIISAERKVEVQASISTCWQIISDVGNTPEWQESMKTARILETDEEGRGRLVEISSDAKVREVTSKLEFSYEPEHSMTWEQVKGDMKWLTGRWSLESLAEDLTRAVYSLEADTGRMLGLLVKGPVEEKVKEILTKDATDGLKFRAEGP